MRIPTKKLLSHKNPVFQLRALRLPTANRRVCSCGLYSPQLENEEYYMLLQHYTRCDSGKTTRQNRIYLTHSG